MKSHEYTIAHSTSYYQKKKKNRGPEFPLNFRILEAENVENKFSGRVLFLEASINVAALLR